MKSEWSSEVKVALECRDRYCAIPVPATSAHTLDFSIARQHRIFDRLVRERQQPSNPPLRTY
jgi:hypothetical protein